MTASKRRQEGVIIIRTILLSTIEQIIINKIIFKIEILSLMKNQTPKIVIPEINQKISKDTNPSSSNNTRIV